jgi:hypothetical protein
MLATLGTALAIALPLVLAPSGAGAAPSPADLPDLVRETRALEAEIAMAGKPNVYFILDARDSRLLVKAAGLTLKVIPITHLTLWGDRAAVRPHQLLRRSTLIAPRRPTVRPTPKKPQDSENEVAAAPATQELEVLEVKDMPVRFQMMLTHGLRIAVRPEPEGLVSRVREAVGRIAWHLARPLPTLWHRVLGRPYTALYVRVAAQDARALYWACADASELLVLIP